jgi:hypothetical protein
MALVDNVGERIYKRMMNNISFYHIANGVTLLYTCIVCNEPVYLILHVSLFCSLPSLLVHCLMTASC